MCKTIRIAESSDMDSWEAVLGHVQVFGAKFRKGLSKRNKCGGDVTQLYQMEWYELLEINGPWWDMVGQKEEFWRNKQIADFSGKNVFF